jgi:gliding motility-associated-like protein
MAASIVKYIKTVRMNQHYSIAQTRFFVTTALLFVLTGMIDAQPCHLLTPSFSVNLSLSPSATYTSPNATRNETCCGGIIPGECIMFTFTLHPNAMGINFGFASGAVPSGALEYQINCGPPQTVGTPICLSGVGPHVLTFCKPGGNANTYSIASIPQPSVPSSVDVRNGCTQTLVASGFSVPTIQWTAVNSGTSTAMYNSYLSCTVGCATVVVTPTNTPPPFVDYEVSGFGQSPCQASFFRDTVRVFFFTDLTAAVSNTTICFGSSTAVITVTASGGKTPHTYTWTPGGANTQSVIVGPGSYTVTVGDQTGCPPTTATVNVSQFTASITANAGMDRTLCKTSPNVALAGSVTGVTTGSWSSNGTGTFTPSNSALNATFVPAAGIVASGTVQLYLTTTNNQGCVPGTHTIGVGFQNPPLVTPLSDQTVCANNPTATLNGTITNFTSTPLWSSPGGGTFSAPANLSTSYTLSPASISAGSVNVILTTTSNGVCPPASDTLKILVTPAPVVNAGPDFTVCSNATGPVSGSVTLGATTGSWSTTGSGSFANAGALSTTYTPGPSDISTGSVALVLSATNFGNCAVVRDTVVMRIRAIAVVTITPPPSVCSSTTSVALSSTITGATNTGTWSTGGTGTFNNNAVLNPVYTISNGDRTAGFVTFTLTSTNNAQCPAVSATATLNIAPVATVAAATTQSICSTQTFAALSGTVTGVTNTGTWSASGSGQFTPSGNNATYSITPADINNGGVTFSLTSTNNSVCAAVIATTSILITKIATITISPAFPQVCVLSPTVQLTSTVSGASGGGTWSHNGAGSLNNVNSLNPIYTVGSGDANATVIFTLTSTNNGPCAASTNTAQLVFIPPATVTPAQPQPVCSSQGTIALSGTITGATSTGTWSTAGTGSFLTNSVSATYSLSAADANNGTVTFTLTSTNNGVCPPFNSQVTVAIRKPAVVNAGANTQACSSNPNIVLSGSVTSASGTGNWSGGNNPGGYAPTTSALNATYSANGTDIANGSVLFTLTSSNDGPCAAVTDTIRIRIVQDAGMSTASVAPVCSTQTLIALSGSVQSTSGTGVWSSGGGGIFSPSPSSLNTNYVPSQADINNGVVNFTLSSTNNGVCPVRTSTLSVTIVRQSSVSVSGPTAICTTTPSIPVSGTVTGGSSSGVWYSSSGIGGAGSWIPGNTFLITTYSLGAADISNGTVLLTLASTNDFPCAQSFDTLRIDIKTPPVATAGTYPPFCSNQGSVTLNGGITGASGTGIWTGSGNGGFSPAANALNAIYYPSSQDITGGIVTLTLTSTGNGACPAASSTATLQIRRQATVDAGTGQSICSNVSIFNLNGQISGVTNSGVWSTNGGGTFNAGNTALVTGYTIPGSDLGIGTLVFTLTSTNNDVCPQVADTVMLTIVKRPTLKVSSDSTLCESAGKIELLPQTADLLSSVIWSSSGSGTFIPNNFQKNVTYLFGSSEIATGSVVLTAGSPSNGACGNLSASMRLKINPSPKAAFIVSSQTITLPADPLLITNQTQGASSYTWNFGDGSTSYLESATHQYKEVGYYDIVLIARNQFDCTDTAEKRIVVIRDVLVPTAFTPDGVGDPANEVFRLVTGGVTEYDLMIFNRWGEMIFHSTEFERGWDGTFNGKPCQQDAYVWKAKITFFDGRKFEKTGSITLLR